jgi:exosortase C (VPDSG-CTERM-specific)
MITPPPPVAHSVVSVPAPDSAARLKILAVLTMVLVVCFSVPLFSLATFAIHSKLYSHIVLIPFVSAYLVWLQRKNLIITQPNFRGFALLLLLVGIGLLIAYLAALFGKLVFQDYLSLITTAFLFLFFGSCFLLLGFVNVQLLSFPIAFLLFMVPFPTALEQAIETVLQCGSAGAAYGLFKLFGMPVFKQGMELHLPGFAVQVAPECSGIHSSLVLFITSLVASYLLLRANWARAIFVMAVIPLAMVRNGFRIFVLGELCVQVDPSWINSDLHHRGGPIFFVLSLFPFFLLLLLLRRFESRNKTETSLTSRLSGVANRAGVNSTAYSVSPSRIRINE